MYVLSVALHMFKVNTAQKMKFSSRNFSVNMTKCGITFTEKILNKKLFFSIVKDTRTTSFDIFLVALLLTLNAFITTLSALT